MCQVETNWETQLLKNLKPALIGTSVLLLHIGVVVVVVVVVMVVFVVVFVVLVVVNVAV